MVQKIISRIIELVVKAQELALSIGIPNILQPGLVKEMIISETLGHELIASKRDADARDKNDPSMKYEYLSCYEGGTGQLDRMFKSPTDKRAESLYRITRNKMIYLAIFYKANPLKIKVIYEIQPGILLKETERQLDRSSNVISHVGFSEEWAKSNGKIVYQG
ncbi:MAG: hypothetical protein A3H61_02030 [Candidatus Jacksonbacteria bacterium RIFCSPLOWO2_02_FULL_44_20]|uniref:Restriction endonuclease n=1 Tax=Candidatus Jacksonbacteria bacterium RIFCSPLOWO2_02_FULL_44_20 TaxID=1798460 RepID=A0A1G2AD34_9BACT|nr:MAG: hypothetical protein UW40_C0032G0020 [Parcubacteria group bacterium GW2011_GWF2_44_17]OGY73940.1 MAG: hypothetical protein A3H61_02030 [Candidatus Jacksonbacteria bacterium RIFCSPLOWO2_02_FULL_44_20]OGY75009.1 MAG: hypothetical protein A3H07_03575 [Candidatus Jacksonbacteria bacterium RIFCSPLOWO2_12_FULL_44_15b]HCA66717.1 hypothetical protein [Candidatus Jacksonbacteria bacterium]HCE87016.1 hypothetical protein [Candidatus Jacksonbacteria bacterium]